MHPTEDLQGKRGKGGGRRWWETRKARRLCASVWALRATFCAWAGIYDSQAEQAANREGKKRRVTYETHLNDRIGQASECDGGERGEGAA